MGAEGQELAPRLLGELPLLLLAMELQWQPVALREPGPEALAPAPMPWMPLMPLTGHGLGPPREAEAEPESAPTGATAAAAWNPKDEGGHRPTPWCAAVPPELGRTQLLPWPRGLYPDKALGSAGGAGSRGRGGRPVALSSQRFQDHQATWSGRAGPKATHTPPPTPESSGRGGSLRSGRQRSGGKDWATLKISWQAAMRWQDCNSACWATVGPPSQL